MTTHTSIAGLSGAPVTAHGLADELSRPREAYKVDTSLGSVRGDVSQQWASRPSDERFDTLSDLYRFKKDIWDRSFDVRTQSARVEAISPSMDFDTSGMTEAQMIAEGQRRMGSLTLGYSAPDGGDVQRIIEAAPTHYAFGQLCQYANFSKRELRKLPTRIAADVLNWQLRYSAQSDDVKLWGDHEECRAIQGPNYGRIGDHDVVAALMGIAGDGKGEDPRFHWKAPGRLNWSNGTYDPEDLGPKDDRTFYGSDRDMFCFMVDDRRPIEVGKTRDGNPDLMFRGFYVQNSMVGARALKVAVFYLRGVCMNRNLWGVERFQETTIRHTSGAPQRWLQEARPALEGFAAGADRTLIEGVARAKATAVIEQDKQAIEYLRRLSFSETQAHEIVKTSEREEGVKPRTVWDFGQAITAFARSARNSDDRLDIELTAKKVFDRVI